MIKDMVIFSQRKNAMNSEQIYEYSNDFLNEEVDNLIELKILKKSNPKNNDFDKKLKLILGKKINDEELKTLKLSNDNDFKKKMKELFEEVRNERINILGEKDSKEIEKRIFLQTIDMNWTSHIQYLEQLRQVIGLRSYGQRDPLIEYKKEAFDLFENLLNKLKIDYLTVLMNLKIVGKSETQKDISNKSNIVNDPKCLLILKKNEKISRNDRCEATGKKFKNCCGAL